MPRAPVIAVVKFGCLLVYLNAKANSPRIDSLPAMCSGISPNVGVNGFSFMFIAFWSQALIVDCAICGLWRSCDLCLAAFARFAACGVRAANFSYCSRNSRLVKISFTMHILRQILRIP